MKHAQLLLLLLLLLVIGSGRASAQKFDDLALTPPMGWNSWNHFGCDISEVTVREAADAMVASGMRDAGYRYVNIDDCWHGERDEKGFIHADPERFPSGMKALADYVHSLGLKLGIYSDAGWQTCAGRPGSRGHEYQDAMQYAAWGIDYLKYDWCNTDGLAARGAYLTMRDALHAAGRPIVFSLCEWGSNEPWKWGADIGHLWRTTGDIYPCFDCIIDHGTWYQSGVMQILDLQKNLRPYAGPGHWNDPDMMEVGNGMSAGEDRAHFTMWAMLAAPLIAGNDLSGMSQTTREILTNPEVISVDQDPLGVEAFEVAFVDSVQTWARPLEDGAWAVTFLNRAVGPRQVREDWVGRGRLYDWVTEKAADFRVTEFSVRDLWKHEVVGTTSTPLAATVPGHDVLIVRLAPTG